MPAPLVSDATDAAGMTPAAHPMSFAELGVPEPLVRALAADGKTEAFPIQADTLPDSLAGRDILGRGRTGSGKTLAFVIPLVSRLCEVTFEPGMAMADYRRRLRHVRDRNRRARLDAGGDAMPAPRGLILAPTRELANQIDEVLTPLAGMAGLTATTVYGGVKQSRQVRELNAGADIVVACPGRLEDLLRQGLLTLASVEVVVIDEADEMADMGFLPPVRRLLAMVRPDAQHMLFSATLDHGIDDLVREFLRDPKIHSVAQTDADADAMTQHVFEVTRDGKAAVVRALAAGRGRRILFTRTKYQAKGLARKLTAQGIPSAELHGNLSQNQRDRNLAAFESGDVNVLVATDVAARGIDVSGVGLVVQVDPPADPKSFVHRSGRTARAGSSGDVVTLVLPDQRRDVRRMLRAAGIETTPVAVDAASPEVLGLAGEPAEPVFGWSLAAPQQQAKAETRTVTKRGRRAGARASAKARIDAPARAASPVASVSGEPTDVPAASVVSASDRRKALRHLSKAGKADDGMGGRTSGAGAAASDDAQSRPVRSPRHGKHHHADAGPRRSGAVARGDGRKRIHRKGEDRIVRDERGEDVKRHERRMIARYGSVEGPRRRHSKKTRAPFRIAGR